MLQLLSGKFFNDGNQLKKSMINVFFYSDETMHKINEDNGNYNIIYRISHIFYSSIILYCCIHFNTKK